jgi:hypothetical protein
MSLSTAALLPTLQGRDEGRNTLKKEELFIMHDWLAESAGIFFVDIHKKTIYIEV